MFEPVFTVGGRDDVFGRHKASAAHEATAPFDVRDERHRMRLLFDSVHNFVIGGCKERRTFA